MTPKEIILQLKENRLARQAILSHFVQNDQTILELVELATTKDAYPIQEHSTWILIHAAELYPAKINAHSEKIIDAFLEANDQTMLRNLCNVIGKLPISEFKEGILLDMLIKHIRSAENKVALHVYSLEKINQFVKKYPEIKPEIEEIIKIKQEVGLAPSMGRVVKEFWKMK